MSKTNKRLDAKWIKNLKTLVARVHEYIRSLREAQARDYLEALLVAIEAFFEELSKIVRNKRR